MYCRVKYKMSQEKYSTLFIFVTHNFRLTTSTVVWSWLEPTISQYSLKFLVRAYYFKFQFNILGSDKGLFDKLSRIKINRHHVSLNWRLRRWSIISSWFPDGSYISAVANAPSSTATLARERFRLHNSWIPLKKTSLRSTLSLI